MVQMLASTDYRGTPDYLGTQPACKSDEEGDRKLYGYFIMFTASR